jgi:hypothetical protein
MTAHEYVCIVCNLEKGCTFVPGGDRLPAICGWDGEGKMITPHWMEVPEKKVLKQIFPFE